MTLDEKISILHGGGMGGFGGPQAQPAPGTTVSNGGAGFATAVPRLGIPAIHMADSAVGVTRGAATSRYSTLLPIDAGRGPVGTRTLPAVRLLIGAELRDQGYTMSWRRREHHARTSQWPQLRVHRRRSNPGGQTGGTGMKGLQSERMMETSSILL